MKWPIGIGGSLTTPPSHTTQRTGPYCAVRLIKADQIQENKLDPVLYGQFPACLCLK
jgi:hypothetical protein